MLIGAIGPAHAVYFGTYELVKDLAGGNVDAGHHPLAAGEFYSERLKGTNWKVILTDSSN